MNLKIFEALVAVAALLISGVAFLVSQGASEFAEISALRTQSERLIGVIYGPSCRTDKPKHEINRVCGEALLTYIEIARKLRKRENSSLNVDPCKWPRVRSKQPNLYKAKFYDLDLDDQRANFCGVNFRDVWFVDSTMIGARFDNATLDGTKFVGGRLYSVRFNNADMQTAQFLKVEESLQINGSPIFSNELNRYQTHASCVNIKKASYKGAANTSFKDAILRDVNFEGLCDTSSDLIFRAY